MRLFHPWGFPGESTGVGCHFLLQRIFPTQGSKLVSHIVGRCFTFWATRELICIVAQVVKCLQCGRPRFPFLSCNMLIFSIFTAPKLWGIFFFLNTHCSLSSYFSWERDLLDIMLSFLLPPILKILLIFFYFWNLFYIFHCFISKNFLPTEKLK